MNNKSSNDFKAQNTRDSSLVCLVEDFLKYTDDLLGRGVISEDTYKVLREKKVEFLNHMKNDR